MIPEKELKIVEAGLAKQAKEDLEFWKQNVPIIAQVIVEAEIHHPAVAQAMKLIWEKGYTAGYIRAVGMQSEAMS